MTARRIHTQELTRNIFGHLNGRVPYAVLRNYAGLPQDNPSRDIDIVIRKSDFKKIRKELARIIETSGWQIVTYLRSDRLATYVCGRISGGEVELVQWDFFFHTSVFGIRLMEADEFLENRQFNGEVYHVSTAAEFLDKFLYIRAVGQSYPEKYDTLKQAAADDPQVAEKLQSVFSVPTVAQAEQSDGKKLLRRALRANLKKHPFRQIGRIVSFGWSYARNYLCSRTGFSLGFTGPDGAGKTTVIQSLHEKVSPVFGGAAVFFHFRPTLLPNLGEAAHAAGIKKEVDRRYEKPHRGGRKGVLSSVGRLCYYTLDYILGFWIKVKPQKRITRMIVFDRYYTDVIADSRRSCIDLPVKFLYYWGKLFVPALNYNILLTADTEKILVRKQELDRPGIEEIDARLHYLSAKKDYFLIRNNGMPDEAAAEILKIVFTGQHQKNRKRLGLKKE